MNLIEALKAARETGGVIRRPFGQDGCGKILAKPTSASKYSLLSVAVQYSDKKPVFHEGWSPSCTDLMAEDWEVVT